jgi:cytochrome c-type biogenesis protein CcmF
MGGAGVGPAAVDLALVGFAGAAAFSAAGGLFVSWGRRCLVVSVGLLTVALVVLARALLERDWSLAYVVDYTSRATPWAYRLAALWAGMAGSLLVWTWLLGLWAVAGALWCRRRFPALSRPLQVALAVVLAVPAAALVWASRPFTRLAIPGIDGAGLTPVLRHPAMLYHPLLLYSGQVATAVPFALAVAARWLRVPSATWVPAARRWMLGAVALLGVAMVAGAHWAYVELGWGGYWAWDQIENAALLPWLAGLAFLHLARRPSETPSAPEVARVAAATFGLALGGALLTRSGVASSVHAFAEGAAVGRVLAGGMVALLAAWVWLELRARRAAGGRTEDRRATAAVSQDGALVVAALLVGALVAVIGLGTVLPVVRRALTGDRSVLTGRYFATVTWPLALVLLALIGVGPRLRPALVWRRFRPALVGVPAVAVAWWWYDRPSALAVTAAGLGAAAAALIVAELRDRRRRARGAGGLVAHLGVAVLLVGVTGTATGVHRDTVVGPDRDAHVRGYTLHLERLVAIDGDGPGAAVEAALSVERHGHHLATLRPRALVAADNQRVSVAGLRSTPFEDLDVTLRAVGPDGREAVVAVSVVPLAWWVWWGGLVVVAGLVLSLAGSPGERERPSPAGSAGVDGLFAPLAAQEAVDGGGRRGGLGHRAPPPPVATPTRGAGAGRGP